MKTSPSNKRSEPPRPFGPLKRSGILPNSRPRSALREGNLTACREQLELLLQRNPTAHEARLLLAEVLLSEDEFDVARGHVEQVLAAKPKDAASQHMMGLLLEAQCQDTEALAYYQRAAELAPDNEQYVLSYRIAAGESPVRLASFQATASDPAEPRADSVPADRRLAEHGDRPEVESALDRAERALEVGDVAAARGSLSRAIALAPDDPQVPVLAAVLALRHEQSELAVFVLQPAAARFADSPAVHRTLGTALYRQSDYPAAKGSLERALSLDKSSALAYLLMGCTLEKLGQSEAAKSQFEEAHRLDPRLSAVR